MEKKNNEPGKINNPGKCEKTLITVDQQGMPKEGLLIDQKNRQFTLADCYMLAIFPNGLDKMKATKREIRYEMQSLIKNGYVEAELSYYKPAQIYSGQTKEKEKKEPTMENDYENRKGKINSLDGCAEILKTRNQYGFPTEALAIDYKNSQFALFDSMALSTSSSNTKKSTHKEIKEKLRMLRDQGFTEADLKHDRYGQIDYRRYLPELKKELAEEMKAKAKEAERHVDAKKTLEDEKNRKTEREKSIEKNSENRMER